MSGSCPRLCRITPRSEHQISCENRCQTEGCVLPKNHCQAAPKHQTKERRSQAFNAEHSGDLGVATKEPRKGRPAAAGRVLMRIVRCRLPGTLLWHPNLNAYSRYVAPTQPMALGTRTPYAQMMHGIYAGLPRNLNTELPAKTCD